MSQDTARLTALASGSIEAMEAIAAAARGVLQQDAPAAADALVHTHDVHGRNAAANFSAVQAAQREAATHLALEPAISRIVAEDDDGGTHVFVVSRFSPPRSLPGMRLVSYRAPMGRIAALPVGEELEAPIQGKPRWLTVVEKVALSPRRDDAAWDSVPSRVVLRDRRALTIESLRRLLAPGQPQDAADEDLIGAILEANGQDIGVTEGFRRGYLRTVSLRDNPVLDRFQDEVFRLPLDSRIALMGPPGSGKTTTLIKRLGQKLDLLNLEQDGDARDLVAQTHAGREGHAVSWLMVSPTDLLKAYVKEAFNKEGIPATDERIQTWDSLRMQLGRRELGILRSADRRGGFVCREGADWLTPEAGTHARDVFTAFDAWQRATFWAELRAEAALLAEDGDDDIRRIGDAAVRRLATRDGGAPDLSVLIAPEDGAGRIAEAINKEVERLARMAANRAMKDDRSFLDGFGALLRRLEHDAEADEGEDEDEADAVPPSDPRAVYRAYERAVRAIALALARGRGIPSASRTGRIAEWLGERLPPRPDLAAAGRRLRAVAAIRRLRNAQRRFLQDVPRRYLRFRAEVEGREAWYAAGTPRRADVAPLELDLVILAMLRILREVATHRALRGQMQEPAFEVYAGLRDLWRTQILVDEATDFSPVQLAALAALSDPATESVMACGDFNQRTRVHGTRSLDDLAWALPGVEARQVTISYRHSRHLNEFAHALAMLSGGAGSPPDLPPDVEHSSVPPVLGRGIKDAVQAAHWLGQRVGEIEARSGKLPTVAVLVSSEDEVRPVAEALNTVLEEQNLRAVACPDGKFVGQDDEVRVFCVQHIKGLEFEAVFFLHLDELAEKQPDLFDKYLYVGATRAATFLGVTVRGDALPPFMSGMRDAFAEQW